MSPNAWNSCMIVAFGGSGFRPGKSGDSMLTTQTLFFESRARARGATPTRKVSTLCRIVCRESHDRIGSRIRDPNAILLIDDDIERPREAGDFDDAPLFHAAAREEEQLIALAVGDPYIAVRRHADAHEAGQLLAKRKVLLARHRTALQVHHEDLAVETRYPDVFPRHGGAPSDSVDPCTHEGVVMTKSLRWPVAQPRVIVARVGDPFRPWRCTRRCVAQNHPACAR